MVRDPDAGELVELWSLTPAELSTAAGKRNVNALAFALLLKFFQGHGRFPLGQSGEIPDPNGMNPARARTIGRLVCRPARSQNSRIHGSTRRYERTIRPVRPCATRRASVRPKHHHRQMTNWGVRPADAASPSRRKGRAPILALP